MKVMLKLFYYLVFIICYALFFPCAIKAKVVSIGDEAAKATNQIQLKAFSGDFDYNANAVHLAWETLAEQNSYFLVLQRSEDMETYEDVCMIKAAGNSASVNAYNCVDVKPMKGMSYYRIKQVSINKSEIFSDVMSINVVFPDSEEASYIIPNPNDGMFRLLVPTSQNEVQIQILDEMGQLVKMISVTNNEPNFYMSLDLRNTLAKGKYYVMIDVENAQHIKKMRVVNSW